MQPLFFTDSYGHCLLKRLHVEDIGCGLWSNIYGSVSKQASWFLNRNDACIFYNIIWLAQIISIVNPFLHWCKKGISGPPSSHTTIIISQLALCFCMCVASCKIGKFLEMQLVLRWNPLHNLVPYMSHNICNICICHYQTKFTLLSQVWASIMCFYWFQYKALQFT